MSTKKQKRTKFEEGSGNVFADLGLKDADQLLVRAKIGHHIIKLLEDRKLEHRETAGVLGIVQPDVSHLMNGHFNHFTTEKLFGFLQRLDRKVKIKICPRHGGGPSLEVFFVP